MQDGASCLLKACENAHVWVAQYLCKQGGEKLLMFTKLIDRVRLYTMLKVQIRLSICSYSDCGFNSNASCFYTETNECFSLADICGQI